MHLGTLLVLIGAIFFILALVVDGVGPRGRFVSSHFLLALAGSFTAFGVLCGAPVLIHT